MNRTKEQALKEAQEAANRTNRVMIVYTFSDWEYWSYGSESWLEGLEPKPSETIEVKPND